MNEDLEFFFEAAKNLPLEKFGFNLRNFYVECFLSLVNKILFFIFYFACFWKLGRREKYSHSNLRSVLVPIFLIHVGNFIPYNFDFNFLNENVLFPFLFKLRNISVCHKGFTRYSNIRTTTNLALSTQ